MESHLAATLAAALLAATPTAAMEIPKPFSATYLGRPYMVGKLEAVITLERFGDHLKYTMRSDASAPFYRNEFYECSVMAVRGERIYPLEYKHTDKHNAAKNVTGRFDWNTNTATVTRAGKETRITDLVWPVWDPLSLQVGIMTDLLNGKFGTEKVYRFLDRSRVRERRLRAVGEDRMETESAVVEAVRIEQSGMRPDRLWFSKEHRYLPVRIELKDIGVGLVSDPAKAARDAEPSDGQLPRC